LHENGADIFEKVLIVCIERYKLVREKGGRGKKRGKNRKEGGRWI